MKKILVVDDEEDITELVKKLLKSEGFDVVTANSGKEALALLESTTPDLIFLDLFMPEMSGWDVLREIRKREELKEVPVIMLTVQPLYESIDREEVREVVDYITKPFDKEDIVEAIRQIPGFYED